MKNSSMPFLPSHWMSAFRPIACCALLGFSSMAFAVCVPSPTVTCLADQPIQSANIIKPNVVFLLDNSGSMDWDYMPDASTSTTAKRRNYQYNTVYYNPNINYTATVPTKPNTSTGAIEDFPSQSFTAAQCDPYVNVASVSGCAIYATTTVNLSTSFKAHSGDTAQAAYYCKFVGGATSGTAPCNSAGYQYVQVSATSCAVTGDVTVCPTGADERVNFANWFSYNRTRILMMKSGMASAFSPLTDKYRVGFHTINNPSSTGTNGGSLIVQDFSGGASGTPKGDWFAKLFKQRPANSTPLQEALVRVGEYYSGNSVSGLPVTVATDPVQYSCQKNFTIMSTDGGWNGPNTGKGNWDKTVPATMPIKALETTYDWTKTGLKEGLTFPDPYYEGTSASTDTLADIAMMYWIKDLRPGLTGKGANNVPTSQLDPAYWQHMNLFTIGLGLKGNLTKPDDWCALQDSTNLPPGCTSYTGPWKNWFATPNGGDTNTTNLAKFDDLWHAGINGHGDYYSADNPTTLATGLTAALTAVADVSSFDAGASASTTNFRAPGINDYSTYLPSYKVRNWSGDVQKFAVDRKTGDKTGGALWSAARMLDSLVNPGLTATVSPTGFTSRNIVTRTEAGAAVAFTYPTISVTQQTALCYKVAGSCVGGDSSLVDYLRGDAKYEGDYGVLGARFRPRTDTTETGFYKRELIGSIVNSQPAYVASEIYSYSETEDPGFKTFADANKTRAGVLYIGANDGMMHAFSAADGNELWAYVPSFVIPTGNDEDGKEKGLRAVSYQTSGNPPFVPHYYVDGPLEAVPVDFMRTGTTITPMSPAGDWRTLLVGGLGKGGKGYFAIDATTPATNISSAKAKILWEFPSAADSSHATVISDGKMGYSFGRPRIAKSYTHGWVVLLPSGYNNSDGKGYLFVLNAKTGELLETLATPAAAPGMAHITGLVNYRNRFVQSVYAGDLNGNVWRFDLGNGPAAPRSVTKFFSSSTSTPISTELNVAIDQNTNKRWIFFGTGRYLNVDDRTIGVGYQQYLMGVNDGTLTTPLSAGLPVTPSDLSGISDLLVGTTSAVGWKYALPASGERNAIKPVSDIQTVAFASLIPTTDPCSPGVSGYAYALDYSTGRSRLQDSGHAPLASIYSAQGISGLAIQLGGAQPGTSGKPQLLITKRDGTSVTATIDRRGTGGGSVHVGWRELVNE